MTMRRSYEMAPKAATEYDYTNQAWLLNGRYVRCGHKPVNCPCFGTVHEGETPDEANADISAIHGERGAARFTDLLLTAMGGAMLGLLLGFWAVR